MDNYIRIWDGVFDEDWCSSFVEKVKNKNMFRLESNEESYSVLSLIQQDDLHDEVQLIGNTFTEAANKYAQACNIKEWQYPKHYGFDEIALVKYANGCDETLSKVYNGGDPRRILHFYLMLNSGPGGNLVLPDHEVSLDRVAGRLVIFPCFFTYPFGIQESVGNAYMIHSFLRDASDLIEKK